MIKIAFPTSTVGSFPQPQELRRARARLRQKKMEKSEYETLVKKHAAEWIQFQEDIGIDVLVGGEFERQDMAAHFGVEFGGRLLDFVPSYENRRYRPVEYFQDITNPEKSILADSFLFYSFPSLVCRPFSPYDCHWK